MSQHSVLLASIEKGADRLQRCAPGRKPWAFKVPTSATVWAIVDNGEQRAPARDDLVPLIVFCCELPTDQPHIRHGRMEVEGDIVVGVGISPNEVLEGVVVHGITKLSRQFIEE